MCEYCVGMQWQTVELIICYRLSWKVDVVGFDSVKERLHKIEMEANMAG